MGSIVAENRKSLMLFSGRGFPELADEIGEVLGVAPTPTDAYDFANGEIFVRYTESVRGSDAFVVQSVTTGVNKWVMETLIMVDALKRGSAKRITVVLPFYPYARQDKKHRGREPISARLVADLLKTAGANRILTVDLHTAQIQGFFDGPVDHLFAMDILAGYVEQQLRRPADDRRRAGLGPGAGGGALDRPAGRLPAGVHPQDPRPAEAQPGGGQPGGRRRRGPGLPDRRRHDRHRLGTICKAAEILYESGAADVIVASTHALLSDPATERLKNSRISEVVVTNTLPLPPEKRLDKITVLSIAPLLARAIREVFDDGSVTTLFGGLS